MDKKIVLQVEDLHVHYQTPTGDVIATSGVSFNLHQGETLGLVGESGCGKSTTAYGILRLIQSPGRIIKGKVFVKGNDLLKLSEADMRKHRWVDLSLIPQGSMNSLNPTMRISQQFAVAIKAHTKISKDDLKQRIYDLLQMVGLPARVYDMYPHELSGGMKQRVCIAIAVALSPPIIIADEATSALDVVVQRVVAQTLEDVKERLNVSMIMIGHDMGLMAQMTNRIAVMYAGHIVEIAPTISLFDEPLHPYSQLLIEAVPDLVQRKPLRITQGITHDPRNPPPGCIFQLRCPFVKEICRHVPPPMREERPGHQVACHLYTEEESQNDTEYTPVASE